MSLFIKNSDIFFVFKENQISFNYFLLILQLAFTPLNNQHLLTKEPKMCYNMHANLVRLDKNIGGIKMKTLYNLLEVEETASADEIKKAYRRIAKEHHPDANVDKHWTDEEKVKHEAILSKAGDAYDILKDEEKRKKYDEKLKEKRERYEQIKKEKERRKKEEAARKEAEAKKAEEARREAKAREESQRRKTSTYRDDYERDYRDNEDIYNDFNSRKNSHNKKTSTFKGRWDRRNREFAKEYRKTHDIPQTAPGVIGIVTLAGLLNITSEMIYQMHRFKKTQAGRFVTKHKSAAVGIAVVIALTTTGFNSFSKDKTTGSATSIITTIETTTSQQEEIQSHITLTRIYTIKSGDTLSVIAENARTSMKRIQEINNISSPEIIRLGAVIEIPYNIYQEDEEYYTDTVEVEDMSLESIATKYETTIETLKKLNEESINYLSDNSYVILSDTLVVPKFPTIKEVKEMKNNTMNDYNTKY